MTNKVVVIFGASGSIGQAICNWFLGQGQDVIAISRGGKSPGGLLDNAKWLAWDPASSENPFVGLNLKCIGSIIWAQGANCNDDIYTFDRKVHEEMYAANVTYILVSLNILLRQNLLAPVARLCIISSIWQNISRQNKLSYCVTKSALQGLVQSLSIDLGRSGHFVNAILPGALDTPMTRANLSADQIARLENMTPLGTLPTLSDICSLVGFLCSENNTGITGQFIAVDKGFSNAKFI